MNLKEKEKARDYALKLISYRERSMREVEIRMQRKGCNEKLIKEILENLKFYDLINDKRFAQEWTQSRIKRGYGKRKIIFELREKGVEEEIIKKIIKEVYAKVDEKQIAVEAVERKKISLKEKAKVYRFLAGRGFTFEIINEVMTGAVSSGGRASAF